MLDNKGFDLWADGYDKSVNLSEEANEYPFAGYKTVLGKVYSMAHSGEGKVILDIGFGSGVLTQRLYEDGYNIYGVDFSAKMIEIAKAKMPNANLIHHDFSAGLPEEIIDKKFDFIISTYAIHHLGNPEKVIFIKQLLEHLNPNGQIVIGDVAFETQAELESCRDASGSNWDSDEIYIVADDLQKYFPNVKFDKISHCAGIVRFSK
ncbi:MAG: class I SAM-dependent methyltransferase [Angelakisella sp.]